MRFFSYLFCSLRLILFFIHSVFNRFSFDAQPQGRVLSIAIHCNALVEASRFIGFINHFHFQCATRTNRLFIIFYLSTPARSHNVLYHQYFTTRVGQGKAMFLFILHRKPAEIYYCLTDRNPCLCSRRLSPFATHKESYIKFLHLWIKDRIADSNHLILLIQ